MAKKFSPKNMQPIVHIFQRPGRDRDSKYKYPNVSAYEESFSHVCMHEKMEKKV